MSLEVATQDCSALTEAQFEEFLTIEGSFTAEQLAKAGTDWVLCTIARIDGKLHGVAIMDHPANFRPSRYHVRDYGLFSVSPFGEGAYQNDKAKAQPVVLEKGKPALRVRYALHIHAGDAAAGKVAEAYEQFLSATQ